MLTDLTIELEPTPAAAGEARQAIGNCLGDSLPAPTVHDLRVIATELVTNAVEHGPDAPIRVSVAVEDDGSVYGEVEDRGRGEIAPDPHGLGLWIVDALADSWVPREDAGPICFEIAARR
jgi:two-component sensor histidine kinase